MQSVEILVLTLKILTPNRLMQEWQAVQLFVVILNPYFLSILHPELRLWEGDEKCLLFAVGRRDVGVSI